MNPLESTNESKDKLLRIRDVLIRPKENGEPYLLACRMDYCSPCTGSEYEPTSYDWSLIEEMFQIWTKAKKIFPPLIDGPENNRKNGLNTVRYHNMNPNYLEQFVVDPRNGRLINTQVKSISEFRCENCDHWAWSLNPRTRLCSQRCVEEHQERRKARKGVKNTKPPEPNKDSVMEAESNIINFPAPKAVQ